MKQFNFYEFTGIISPGVVILFAFVLINPTILGVSKPGALGVGDLGVFIVLAYVAGHLIQVVGNGLEFINTKISGGKPSDWIRTNKNELLAKQQWSKLPSELRLKLDLDLPASLSEISEKDWSKITKQVYAAVEAAGRANRVDIFNGNYGLLRGVCASLVGTIFLLIVERPAHWSTAACWVAVMFALAFYRMRRFSQHYAREVFLQFLQLPKAVQEQRTTKAANA